MAFNLKVLPMAGGKIPAARPSPIGLSRRSNLPGSAGKKVATTAFHQTGSSVSKTQHGQRSEKIYGSVNSAIKNKRASNPTNGNGRLNANNILTLPEDKKV